MVARIRTVAFEGVDVRAVDSRVQASGGMPAFRLVGPIAVQNSGRHIRNFVYWMAGLLGFLAITLFLHPVEAASFNCGKAERVLEKIICADPALSKLDEEMAAAYKAALLKLDSEAGDVIRSEQQAWLKYLVAYCSATDRAGWTTAECIDMEYTRRIQDLDKVLSIQAGYTFLQRSEYQVIKIEADPEGRWPAETGRHYLSYPQIIAPSSADTRRWNEDIQEWARSVASEWAEMDDNPQVYISAVARASLSDLVSIEKSVSWMGAAHLWGRSWFENTLVSSGKELNAARIFEDGTGWKTYLADRAFNAITPEPGQLQIDREFIQVLTVEPEAWIISPDTLTIRIDPDGDDGRQYGATEVVYSWRELKPYLRSDLPICLNLD
jgi:uncharacterized protein